MSWGDFMIGAWWLLPAFALGYTVGQWVAYRGIRKIVTQVETTLNKHKDGP